MPEATPLSPELSRDVSALAGDAADRWRVWGDVRPGLVSQDRTSLTALIALERATHLQPSDLFGPQVEILLDRLGEAVDPGPPGLDPIAFM
jgi:hypothetical protein